MSAPPVRAELAGRFRRAVRDGPLRLGRGSRMVVAVSGGLDSVALLHLLRFTADLPAAGLVVAHFDHRMRPGSGGEAAWVRGLATAWELPAHLGRASEPPTSEAEARAARYAFLERVRIDEDAAAVVTAHTADDQAETVLMRAVRGTGPNGLAGIPAFREPGVWRPLLGFWRRELEAYVANVGLGWREDPTNRDRRFARNVVRHLVLPELERSVAPAAREALVRLAAHAREDEAAWAAVVPRLLEELGAEETPTGHVVPREGLLASPPALRARLVRFLAFRAGRPLDRERTRAALDFVADAVSGSTLELGGSVELRREFDRIVLAVAGGPSQDRLARIGGPGGGEAHALISGRAYRVTWGPTEPVARERATFRPGALAFPLSVRGWRAGDRIRMRYGHKKLKKLFGERRVAARARREVPVLVDAHQAVLWVPGVARAAGGEAEGGIDVFHVGIADAP